MSAAHQDTAEQHKAVPSRKRRKKGTTTGRAKLRLVGGQDAKLSGLAKALLDACGTQPRPVGRVIAEALAAEGWTRDDETGAWTHPEKKGKTPTATAHAMLVALARNGQVTRPKHGYVARPPRKPGRKAATTA